MKTLTLMAAYPVLGLASAATSDPACCAVFGSPEARVLVLTALAAPMMFLFTVALVIAACVSPVPEVTR